MAFNIDNFQSDLNARNGLMRPNRFEVNGFRDIPGVTDRSLVRSLSLWCAAVQIPGYQFMTHDVRRYTYGTNESRPFSPNFEPIQLTFYADGNGEILDFWHNWMSYIMPHDMSAGINANRAYLVKYKDDYVTDLRITYYREDGTAIKSVAVRGAYPININSIPLAWGELNTHVTFSVFIDYLDWYIPADSPITT